METFVNSHLVFEKPRVKTNPVTHRHPSFLVLSFFVLIALSLGLTMRRGHDLGDDFAMYISHARNIVEGKPYAATGYIYNPHYPGIGPKTYPPVFPLMLAPVYKIFGFDLEALKMVGVVAAWSMVLLFYLYWRKELPTATLLLLLATLGFNPVISEMKNHIISDLPFLCWTALALLLIQRIYEQGQLIVGHHLSAFFLGTVIYLAYGTRSIGLVLLVGLVLYELLRTRRLSPMTLEVIGIVACLAVLQNFYVHSDSSYGHQFSITATNIRANIKAYSSEYSVFWGGGYSALVRYGLFVCLGGLAGWGWLVSIKQRVTYFAIFALIYMPPILLVSLQIQLRYLVPLMAPTLYFAWRGIADLSGRLSSSVWLPQAAFAALTLSILTSYALVYRRANWQPYLGGPARKETQQLVNFVRQTTAPDDVLVFIYPRTLALLTKRHFAAWHMPKDESELFSYWKSIRARYVVTGPAELEPEHQAYLQQLMAHHAHKFKALYNNGVYQVYRLIQEPNGQLVE